MLAVNACLAYNICMQYTIRNVPEALDSALRDRAKSEKRSLNDVVIQALARGLGFSKLQRRHRDLRDLAGSWKEDPEFDKAIADHHAIEEELWK
jgi:hypothetical protein